MDCRQLRGRWTSSSDPKHELAQASPAGCALGLWPHFVQRFDRARWIVRFDQSVALEKSGKGRITHAAGRMPHLEQQRRHRLEIGTALRARVGLRLKPGVAQPNAAVVIKEYVARMDCAMNQPARVQGAERCEHSLRKRSDVSHRRRPDREEAAEASAWIESANHSHGIAVDGNTNHLHQGVVFAASAPRNAAHQPQLRFVAFARHSLCHADLGPPNAHEPCIAVKATAKAP